MFLTKHAGISLLVLVAGFGGEWYYLGSAAVGASALGFLLLACLFANTFGWWLTSPFDVGDILDFTDGHHAVLHVSGIRHKVCVVPVRQTMTEMSYERTGEPFCLGEDDVWAKLKGFRLSCSIASSPKPN